MKKILILAAAFQTLSFALQAAPQPTESSVKELLQLVEAPKGVLIFQAQLKEKMTTDIEKPYLGKTLPPAQQKTIATVVSRLGTIIDQTITYKSVEDKYVKVYQGIFSQGEVNSLITLFKTATGKMLIAKLPIANQQTGQILQDSAIAVKAKFREAKIPGLDVSAD